LGSRTAAVRLADSGARLRRGARMNGPEFDGPDWREPLDAAARSPVLAARLSASLPARPRLLDLGAGTGSLFRWLAPRIGRAQAWLLADDDDALVAEAFERTLVWA